MWHYWSWVNTFAAITAMSLFGVGLYLLCTVNGEVFAHSSCENCSRSAKFDGDRRWTAIFKSHHKCSIGFNSGLRLDHSRTFIFFFFSHSSVAISFVLQIIVLLKCKSPTQFQIHGWLKQVFIKDSPVLCTVLCPFYPDKFASPWWWKAVPITWCCQYHAWQ